MLFRLAILAISISLYDGIVLAEEGESMQLSRKNSGYDLNEGDWISFLGCWKELSERMADRSEGSLMRFSKGGSESTSNPLMEVSDVKLPKSLIDFHKAYKTMGGKYRSEKHQDGIGIVAPNDIESLSTYNRELLRIKNEWSHESEDINYFKYGIDQDDSAVRTSYQNNAIVIGQYGFSNYELIVVYPDSLTEDGEMETAIFAHAAEARAPSFAEMMRQLSFFFTQSPDLIPIYSQEQLIGTCADKLPLKEVWWR